MSSTSPFVAVNLSEKDLLQHAVDLESIYTDRRHDILRLLLHSGVNVAEAEDVTQQVFLNAYERPVRGVAAGSLFPWLVTCAKNLAVSRYRRSKREMLAPAERWKEWEESIAAPGKSILAQLEAQQEYAILTHALAQLTVREQQCILLRSQGYTYDEAADALSISRRSAVYAVSTALASLQQALRVSDNPEQA